MDKIPKDPIIGSIMSALLTLLGALEIADRMNISADQLAMAVGALGTLIMAFRALQLRGKAAPKPIEEDQTPSDGGTNA